MNETMAQGARSLLDWQAINDTLVCHSRGIDRADVTLLRSVYHSDAAVDYGFFKGPAIEFAPLLCEAQQQGPVTMHRSAAPWIAVAGDSACSETAVIACAQTSDESGSMQRLIGGRYLDRHSRRDGEWRLSHRRYVLDWNINRPGASSWPDPAARLAAAVPRGGHGEADAGRALLTLAHTRLSRQGGGHKVNANTEQLLDQALAKVAVHDLLMAYARGVDRADRELLVSIFHPDATVITGVFNGPAREFASEITQFVTANLDRCFHSIANEWVEVQGDRAIAEAYVIATATAAGTDTLTGGRYLNEFERRDGRWKISSHSFVVDWNMNLPTSYQTDGMYASLDSRGCFGREDPVYALWSGF